MADFSIKAVISAVDKFTAPMRRITGSVSGPLGKTLGEVGRKAGAVGSQVRSILGPISLLGGIASVGGVVSLVNSFQTGGDEIAKFSRQVGLSAEAYQELQFAADRSGVSQEKFNSGLDTFAKRIGKAKAGTGVLFSFLSKASPELLKQVQAAKSNEEAFTLMTAAIAKVGDPNQKQALADAAFGILDMSRVAEGGVEGLSAVRKEARALGLVISTESAQAAEAFNDTMTNMHAALSGVQNVIGAQLLPILQPLIEKFTAFVVANRELIGSKITEFVSVFANRLAQIDIGKVFDGLMSFFNLLGRGVEFVGGLENAFILFVGFMNGPLIVSILSLAGSIGKLLFLLKGPLLTVLPIIGTALKALGVAAVANPLGAVLVVLAGAAALIIANWERVEPFFSSLWEGISGTFTSSIEFISGIIDGILGKIQGFTSGVQAVGRFLGFGGGEQAAGGSQAAGSGLNAPGSALSALPKEQPNHVNGEIKVKFENAPAGTRIQSQQSNQSALDIATELGSRALSFLGVGG